MVSLGVNLSVGPAYQASEEEMRKTFDVRMFVMSSVTLTSRHFQVNVVGTFVLFKAALPLLQASKSSGSAPPKFVAVSSQAGGIDFGASLPMQSMPYGVSKAAENYLVRKLHFEHEKDGLGANHRSSPISDS